MNFMGIVHIVLFYEWHKKSSDRHTTFVHLPMYLSQPWNWMEHLLRDRRV